MKIFVFGTVSTVTSQQLPNCTWDHQTRDFSNEIISHWMNIATTGKPLFSWSSYNPSQPQYFHITPDQGFISELWIRIIIVNCKNILQTRQGFIYGRQTQNTTEYLGIQFAKVIRWKPPIDLAEESFHDNIHDGTSFGPCCPQPTSETYIPEQDEQCLYLNIYKPNLSTNHSSLPVFVWIHGGAHKRGCASERIPILFNGTNIINHSLKDQPVIIVTINYRLGILADMYLKELIEEDPQWPTAGNYMYLDMLSALRWIQKNIIDYGGDPKNVTLFGQSAGGLSVTDLGAVRGSSGLYRSAIVQSGVGAPGTYSSYYNMNNSLSFSNTIVEHLNCSNENNEKVLSCIRNISITHLFNVYGDRYTRPIIDNYFFPLYPPLSIRNGTYNNISLIMGHNDFEQAICNEHPDMNLTEAITTITANIEKQWIPFVIDYYQLNQCLSDRNANNSRCCNIVRLILMDKNFECDIRRIFDSFYLKFGSQFETNKLFSYHLNCYPQCPITEYKGICGHSEEVPYVFGLGMNVDILSNENCTWDNQSRIFSNNIIAHWINTAVTGRPLSQWPSYDPIVPKYFHITPDQGFISEIWNRNCSFFDQIEAQGVKETFGV